MNGKPMRLETVQTASVTPEESVQWGETESARPGLQWSLPSDDYIREGITMVTTTKAECILSVLFLRITTGPI